MDQLLLLIPTTSYQVSDFVNAASKLDVHLVVVTNQPMMIQPFGNDNLLFIEFSNPGQAAAQIREYAIGKNFTAIIGVDEVTTLIAAIASEALNLSGNTPESVRNCHNKFLFRQSIADSELLCPAFQLIKCTEFERLELVPKFPCVLKPLGLSASRGVIRADNSAQFIAAANRIQKLLQQCVELPVSLTDVFMVEDFIPGAEVAVEGMLLDGRLTVLAIFDKPDPLDGPFFEETIYLTPSSNSTEQQHLIIATVQQACHTLKLLHGPIHAELRLNDRGCWIIELAARSIGGRCSRTLEFTNGCSLQELILRQALGYPVEQNRLQATASGVMMIPVTKAGKLTGITGMTDASSVPGIRQINFDIPIGDDVIPLPEGDRYLGFIFARGSNTATVETALREAFSRLKIEIW